jgi:hypothetical protein
VSAPVLGQRRILGAKGNSYVVRVPNDCLNGSTGRRWYAIHRSIGLGHFRNKRNAIAAVYRAEGSR